MSHLKIFKGTGILTSADVLSRVFEILRIVFITHFFSVAEFGLFSLAVATALLFSALVMPSFSNVILQYFSFYRKKNAVQAKRFFSSTLIFVLIMGVILGLVVLALTRYITIDYYQKPELFGLLKIAALLIVLQPLADFLMHFLFSLEKFKTVFWGKIVFSLFNLGLVIWFFFSGFKIEGLLYAFLLAYLIQGIFFLFSLRKYLCWGLPRLEKRVLKFWYPLIGAALFKNLTVNLPMIIIGRLLDTLSIGIYQIAEKTIKLILSFTDPYLNSIKVVCINTYHESREKFVELFNVHLKYSSFLIVVVGAMSVIAAKLVFSILYGQEYQAAVPIFLGLIPFGVLGTINAFFPRLIYSVKEKSHYYFWSILVFTLVQIGLLIFLTLNYELWGLVGALFVGRLFGVSLNILLCKKAEPRFALGNIIIPILLFMVIYLVGFFLVYNFNLDLHILGVISLFVYMVILCGMGFINFKNIYKEFRNILLKEGR